MFCFGALHSESVQCAIHLASCETYRNEDSAVKEENQNVLPQNQGRVRAEHHSSVFDFIGWPVNILLVFYGCGETGMSGVKLCSECYEWMLYPPSSKALEMSCWFFLSTLYLLTLRVYDVLVQPQLIAPHLCASDLVQELPSLGLTPKNI